MDRNAVLEEIRAALAVPPSHSDRKRRDLARALIPFVREVYSGDSLPDRRQPAVGYALDGMR